LKEFILCDGCGHGICFDDYLFNNREYCVECIDRLQKVGILFTCDICNKLNSKLEDDFRINDETICYSCESKVQDFILENENEYS